MIFVNGTGSSITRTLSVLLVYIMLGTLSMIALVPRHAEAQWAVFDGANVIQTTVSASSNTASAGFLSSLNIKELALDAIAWTLINALIEQMISDVTQWVVSGFEGKPAFLEDLTGFLTDLTDSIVGDYIWNSDALGFLCSPFSMNVKLALDLQYSNSRDYRKTSQCTLSGIGDNLENFMGQSWDNWFQVTMNPSNNPYGAFDEARAGLSATIASARGSATKELEFGSGFFSQKECVDDPMEPGEVGPPSQTCKTITPGETIQTNISDALNIPRERLGFADEINELISALIGQLARGVLSEVSGGLSGLGGGSGGGGPRPIFDGFGGTNGSGLSGTLNQQFEMDEDRENRYLTLSDQAITRTTAALNGRSVSCQPSMRQRLEAFRTAAENGADDAEEALEIIADFRAQMEQDNVSPEQIQTILNNYMRIRNAAPFHTDRQIAELEAVLTAPPGTGDDLLEAAAAAGNMIALALLYEDRCPFVGGGN
jgi:hypothetical protein